jgi:putative tryptophan/tyrosine transport system substrate-binding protein
MISRRHQLAAMLGAVVAPCMVEAQDKRRPLVGILWHAGSPEEEKPYRDVLLDSFAKLGYRSGTNIAFEERYPAEQLDRFRHYAEELVGLNVDVLVAISAASARAAKAATSTIPIVFGGIGDPVAIGVVANLSRPGGNVTGFSLMSADLQTKRLQVLLEVLPRLSRLALLAHPTNAYPPAKDLAQLEPILRQLPAEAEIVEVTSPESLDAAFAAMSARRFDAVFLTQNPFIYLDTVKRRIAGLALAHRLPTISPIELLVEEGALMSYGPKWQDVFLGVAPYVDRILRGTKPGDLPVQQPTSFELVINQKTANALGINLPASLLARAHRVIE